ncbi:MAG: M23 family metallopeptidase [Actinomycetota bacterium]|nr:M23 family metallopeptidase [Actinomycetota bacterium]
MSEFGWTRLAYLSVVLTILALLVKLGTFGASSISENFPESALTFAQNNGPVFEEHLDWESRAADYSGATRAGNDDHSEETHSDDEHSEDEHSEEAHSEDEHSKDHGHSHEPVESIYENVNFEEDAPVFYRPAPQVSSASRNPSSTGAAAAESCQTVGDTPPGSEILFPTTREHFDSYDDTWGAARPQGGHEGTDLMVPNGTPLLAMTDGRVVPVSGANGNGWNTLGGYTVMLEAAYSVGPVKEGDLFYYAHMDRQSDLRIGDTVEAGDVVGFAGDTGQGPEGSRGQFPPHLHLGWYETSRDRTQLASGAMNPYPLLEWVKANGGSIAGGSDIPYCEAPQSSAPTPSGGGYWQFPSDPGTRPDMATGTGTATPSPVVEQNDSSELSPDITREPVRPTPNPAAPPANPDPSDGGDEMEAPIAPSPPPGGTPSSPNLPIPNLPNPLPDIGEGIGDIIGGILNPRPPEPPDNETTAPNMPPPTEESTAPEETTDPGTPPENPEETIGEETTDEETTDEESTPEDTTSEETTPEETAPEETTSEDTTGDESGEDECEPRDRVGGDGEVSERPNETDGEPRDHSDGGEDCSEETDSEDNEDTTSEEEATEQIPPDGGAVGDQYEDERPNLETTFGP